MVTAISMPMILKMVWLQASLLLARLPPILARIAVVQVPISMPNMIYIDEGRSRSPAVAKAIIIPVVVLSFERLW